MLVPTMVEHEAFDQVTAITCPFYAHPQLYHGPGGRMNRMKEAEDRETGFSEAPMHSHEVSGSFMAIPHTRPTCRRHKRPIDPIQLTFAILIKNGIGIGRAHIGFRACIPRFQLRIHGDPGYVEWGNRKEGVLKWGKICVKSDFSLSRMYCAASCQT